jgi:hypothetical protein
LRWQAAQSRLLTDAYVAAVRSLLSAAKLERSAHCAKVIARE